MLKNKVTTYIILYMDVKYIQNLDINKRDDKYDTS